MAGWIDELFQWAGVPEPWNDITQGFRAPNTDEPGGWHHGVDVALPGNAELYTPASGVYDPSASGKYRVAIDLGNGEELIFAHVLNRLYGQSRQPVSEHADLGSVLAVNPANGQPFGPRNERYTDPAGGWYAETGPHVHVELHRQAGAQLGADDVLDPTGPLPSGAGGQSGNSGWQLGPVTIPNPVGDIPGAISTFGNQVTGAINQAQQQAAEGIKRYLLTGALVLAGFAFLFLAFRKPMMGAAQTATKTAALAA